MASPHDEVEEVISDAVYIASRNGQDEVVAHLLTRSPDLGFRAFLGGTALHWAYWSGSRAAVDLLLRAGAQRDGDGKTPGDLARERPDRPGCVEAAQRLERAMG